jgi:RNase P protein component
LPVHAHARIGAGEVVVEILARDGVRLSLAHGKSVIGDVKRNEVRKVLKEAAEITQAIRAEWRAMHK